MNNFHYQVPEDNFVKLASDSDAFLRGNTRYAAFYIALVPGCLFIYLWAFAIK